MLKGGRMVLLPANFYDRDALEVAGELVGAVVEANGVALRISEVEAYRFPGDTANHARAGKTARNAPMWGPPGRAYVYLCYGMHHMLNFVTGPDGHAAAVLVRGGDVVAGQELFIARRPDGRCDGPGKLAAALALTTAHSGARLDGSIRVYARSEAPALVRGPRVGIDYASEADRLAPWRLADAGSRQVGRRRKLS
jgi:DNA-3-methyladenine glycosylase